MCNIHIHTAPGNYIEYKWPVHCTVSIMHYALCSLHMFTYELHASIIYYTSWLLAVGAFVCHCMLYSIYPCPSAFYVICVYTYVYIYRQGGVCSLKFVSVDYAYSFILHCSFYSSSAIYHLPRPFGATATEQRRTNPTVTVFSTVISMVIYVIMLPYIYTAYHMQMQYYRA
jgi:hypothetical protein